MTKTEWSQLVLALFWLGCTADGKPETGPNQDVTEADASASTNQADAATDPALDARATPANPDSDGGALAFIPYEEFCNRALDVMCFAHMNCCPNAASADDCRAGLRDYVCGPFSGVAYTDGRIIYDGSGAAQAFARAYDEFDNCRPLPPDLLDGIFTGTVATGGDCAPVDDDLSPYASCEPDLTCNLDTSTGDVLSLCGAPAAIDGDCSLDECVPHAFCADDYTCQSKKPDSAQCEDDSECVSNHCGEQAACAPIPKTVDWCF